MRSALRWLAVVAKGGAIVVPRDDRCGVHVVIGCPIAPRNCGARPGRGNGARLSGRRARGAKDTQKVCGGARSHAVVRAVTPHPLAALGRACAVPASTWRGILPRAIVQRPQHRTGTGRGNNRRPTPARLLATLGPSCPRSRLARLLGDRTGRDHGRTVFAPCARGASRCTARLVCRPRQGSVAMVAIAPVVYFARCHGAYNVPAVAGDRFRDGFSLAFATLAT
jgi:hypothetical protein